MLGFVEKKTRPVYKVHGVRFISETAYILRFDRQGMEFETGQYLSVGVRGSRDQREYSIYSSETEDFLEILVKEVDGGKVSKALGRLKSGDELEVQGPFGYFLLDKSLPADRKLLFIATGTGISPFHSFASSRSGLDYLVLHGMRTLEDAYGKDYFPGQRYLTCVSRGTGGGFSGRVTEYLRQNPVEPGTLCYLCGNCEMIYEVFDILKTQGIEVGDIFTEVYF